MTAAMNRARDVIAEVLREHGRIEVGSVGGQAYRAHLADTILAALVNAGLVRTTPTPGLLEEFSDLVQEWVRSATRAQSYAGAKIGPSDHKELLAYARGLDRCAAALMTAIKKGQVHE